MYTHTQEREYKANGDRRVHTATATTSSPDGATASPFGSVSATMGWETFHLVQTLWLGQVRVRQTRMIVKCHDKL